MVDAERLKDFAERIRAAVPASREAAALYEQAKAAGFDTSVLRQVIREMDADPTRLAKRETALQAYRVMLGVTPVESFLERALHA